MSASSWQCLKWCPPSSPSPAPPPPSGSALISLSRLRGRWRRPVCYRRRDEECFDKIHPRSEQFADWYFSKAKSSKLIQEATLSLARHATKVFKKTTINEAMAAVMDKFLTQKYERIVLRPEINNSEP